MEELHPLYPFLTGILAPMLGGAEQSAVIVSVVAGSLIPIPLYLLVRDLWNEPIAWVTTFLYAIHPVLALETSEALPTALFLFLFFSAASCGVRAWTSGRWWHFPPAGALAALCYLTRTEGIQAAVFLGIALAGATIRRTQALPLGAGAGPARGRMVAGVLLGVLAFTLISMPYVLFIREKTGQWGFTLKGAGREILSKALTIEETPGRSGDAPPGPAAGRDAPVRYLSIRLANALFPPLMILMAIGLFCTGRQGGRWSSVGVLLIMGLVAFVPSILLLGLSAQFRPSHRYLLLTSMLWLPWASAAVLTIPDALSRMSGGASSGARLALPALLVVLLVVFPLKSLGPRRAEESVFREVGRWLSEQKLDPPRRIMASNEKPVYYGRADLVPMPMQYVNPEDVSGRSRPVGGYINPDIRAGVLREWARRVHEQYVRARAALLVLDEPALNRYDLGPGGLSELEKLGFRQRTAFGRSAGHWVWVLALEGS